MAKDAKRECNRCGKKVKWAVYINNDGYCSASCKKKDQK